MVVIFGLFLLFLLLDWLFPLDIDRLNKPKSRVVYDKNGFIAYISLSSDGFVRVPLEGKIPQNIIDALLSYEDRYFYYHFGVNPLSLFRALIFDITHSRKIGASTITMQVARMMHHRPRDISSKIIEMFEALQLEWRYSKSDILRFYLNNAPYGGNIEGISSASLLYFNLPLKSLSRAQSSYLISIPKNPNRNSPKNISRVQRLKNRVLSSMLESGKISQKLYKISQEEQINPKRRALPKAIPTLSRYFKAGITKSSIDLNLQKLLRDALKAGLERVKDLNIHNASGVIIDNYQKSIVAYVGSATFWSGRYSSKIDGVKAIISAGSTLKPFIYAKAFESGIITPKKFLFDIKYFIGDFMPENFDGRFLGEVSANDALAYSRNIPALWLNRVLGRNSLYELLKMAKIGSIEHPKSYYGDVLALGGGGIRLLDLANLYSALATDGVFKQSHFSNNSTPQKGIKILSKEACWLTLEALASAPRGRFATNWEFVKGKKQIAFKTGTSSHSKDMLSIGVTPKYTVAIWFGNFDRKGGTDRFDKRKSGLRVATPVLLNIFDSLEDSGWFTKPKRVVKKEVCLDPIVINKCKKRQEDWVIRGVFLHTPCEVLTPTLLLRLIDSGKIESLNSLKSHNCFKRWREYKPLIEGLGNNKKYIKNRLLPKEYKKIKLKCYSFEDNSTIYWLINDKEPIKSKSGEATYIYLPPNNYTIRCIDMGSKEAKVRIKIDEI